MSPSAAELNFIAIDKYGATKPELFEEPMAARLCEVCDPETARKVCHPWDENFDVLAQMPEAPRDYHELEWTERKPFNHKYYADNLKDEARYRWEFNRYARLCRFPPVEKLSDVEQYLPPGTLKKTDDEIVEKSVFIFKCMREVFEGTEKWASVPLARFEAELDEVQPHRREEMRKKIVWLKALVDDTRATVEYLQWEYELEERKVEMMSREPHIQEWLDQVESEDA